ncbi:hypothetical protein TI04_02775 [Achromatium sp. WMS2]|nr:hypothetical protein TI04_02775 [Achromatium sp. WMS2]
MNRWILAGLLAFSSMIYAQTPNEVLKAADDIRAPGENFGFSLRVVALKNNTQDSEFTLNVRVKDSVKSLVTYESPANAKGKRLLMVEQNMWIYIPGTRRPIRISPQQQLLGQVSNADVARVVYSLDYNATSMKFGKWQNQDVKILELKARSATNSFQRIDLTVAALDNRPLEAKFYAFSGRLLKVLNYQDYRMALGTQRPMRLEVYDAINRGNQTIMYYSSMELMDTPNMYFQKDYLPRLR